jgi:hypothetical protein
MFDKDQDLTYTYVCPYCNKRFFDDGTMVDNDNFGR